MWQRWALILGIWSWLVGCGTSVEPPAAITLRGVGSDSLVPLVRHLGTTFTDAEPTITIELDIANTQRALTRLQAGEIDFALTTIQPPEIGSLQFIPIARDGLVLIVHPENRAENLTLQDVNQLYRGQIFNWRDVQGTSGLDGLVQVIVREPDSGTGQVFQTYITPDQPMTPNARVFANSQAIVNFVAQHPEAIGYVSQAHVVDKVKTVAIEELRPTPETLANGAYPLSYVVYLVLPAKPSTVLRDFAEYITGPAGQAQLAEWGFGRVN